MPGLVRWAVRRLAFFVVYVLLGEMFCVVWACLLGVSAGVFRVYAVGFISFLRVACLGFVWLVKVFRGCGCGLRLFLSVDLISS